MFRTRNIAALTLVAVALTPLALRADVRADEKTHVEFAGMLGHMVNMFGGKAAKEGVTSSVAVKGDRKATLNDQTGQIIDLAEEKIYDLDLRKKSYKVTTFAQLRQRMEDAKKKAEADAQKQQPQSNAAPSKPAENNVEIDLDVKNTGQKKNINGFDTHEVVMTITIRQKGETLEQGGGMVLTMDSWLAPKVAAMKEISDFDMRYAQKLYGPMIAGASAEEMAAAAAMYPLMAPGLARMRTEGAKMDGTPISTLMTFDSVKSADQIAQEASAQSSDSSVKPSGGVGGMLGSFAKKAAAKKMGGDDAGKARSTVMTSTNDVLKIVTDVSATDVAVPTGFKENK
jgi:hypothetical protein